jgi:hypothetical protein
VVRTGVAGPDNQKPFIINSKIIDMLMLALPTPEKKLIFVIYPLHSMVNKYSEGKLKDLLQMCRKYTRDV